MGEELVRLNIYSSDGQLGMAYHSGVEVYGAEYCFVGSNTEGSGVIVQVPREQPPCGNWVYYQTIVLAPLQKSKVEVQSIVDEFCRDFPACSYDIFSRNCNHFSDAFCQRLCGQSIPSWVNVLANVGDSLGVGELIYGITGAVGGAVVGLWRMYQLE